ncbi:hypothetical protein ACIF8W_14930 [Streptomyces sp. NPDC085639]|uniref:hypothetical protein n=1 Tax=Streptomyces sp. NPDC085639 TaxID=3365734 RepID=UPI0037D50AA0
MFTVMEPTLRALAGSEHLPFGRAGPRGAATSWGPGRLAGWIFDLSYVPLLLGGPLLGILPIAYWRRRRMHG